LNQNYLSCGYDSILWSKNEIKAYLSTGQKFSLDNIILDSASIKLCRQFGLKLSKNKKFLHFRDFIKFRERIVDYYGNNGYPFTSVRLSNLKIQNSGLNAELIVEKRDLFRIDSIVIKGNPKISRKFVINQIQIKSGEYYKQSKIDNLGKIFDGLSFIKQIKPAEIEFRKSKADLYLYLKSNPSNFFSGMIGFVSDSIAGKGLNLSGDINLILQNSLKIGDKMDFYWNKFGSNSQNLRVSFQLPYIFILPLGFNCHIGLEKFQTSYLNTDFYFAISYALSTSNSLKAFLQKKNSFIIEDTLSNNKLNSGFSSTTAGLGYRFDNTDYSLNPGKGFFLEASFGYGSNYTKGKPGQLLVEFNFDGARYFKINQYFNIALLNKSSALYGPNFFYQNQLLKLGGINTLRGFDEKSIYASAWSVFSLEPRVLFGKNSAFFLFTDLAWYESRLLKDYYMDWPLSVGAGMNIDTKAGIFKLVYALGKQQNNTFKFSNSKVHFGFSARF